jgi:GNAT superfamily N-acetyltransferase
MSIITPIDIQANPLCITTNLVTASGLVLTFRPITPQDHLILGEYFLNLSETTRNLYGPHPFDQATANKLCAEINYADTIRLIATIPNATLEKVIAYFFLQLGVPTAEIERYAQMNIALDPQADCLVAPSVADAYQNQGVGSPLMRHVFDVARKLGRKHIVLMGGVYVTNERAVHYYQKAGFRTVGTFIAPWASGRESYDMFLEL